MHEKVTRLFLIGLSKYHPLNGPDTVDLAEFLARKAAALHHLAAALHHLAAARGPSELYGITSRRKVKTLKCLITLLSVSGYLCVAL